METNLYKQLRLHIERGKNVVTFTGPADVISFGQEVIKVYTDSPITPDASSLLKFVQTHKEQGVALAQVILTLKGWLITHTGEATIRPMIQKRVYDLSQFYIRILLNLRLIANLATVGLIEDNAMTVNNAKSTASQMMKDVEEMTAFVCSDFVA
ncbi:TPA: hypothetical protein DIU27_05435 [Candidatus Collierbacteria bacterium]|uniref:Uncharacterized protein n=1 Tax=Candidatus Collierbacteria bacterium GW2011_GWB2_44_22 TaxID=1618387 RepID=A0A0G1HXP8_9BACT|nr:MAG: hypothetical protein UW31_C0002G0057 [Candidatus Collierbacteria bacterium GW2011_GWA2_44_13]KKT51916.1 MAG: hypothetical protein UW44_C0006G0034 [Candidatus Collierbacteria bacterium GW2011_GWB2_44_22]KKT61872.1 MAG: hypothetical protein UW56_C0016G0006 [Candidatus Collierbacteria bacterium GW2011_GWD1_44_27]KKT68844.1 MAG: hypothetical protein UW64_C0009G0056 [Microgenomates group bacterium GW2011_GWC1_44_37]HCQ31785.1 hypothetical protein [Candidatus Collierbacteria bacterium]